MRPSLQTTTLTLLALIIAGAAGQELITSRDKYCKDVQFQRFTLASSELKSLRDHTYTDFYDNYDHLFEFVADPNSNTFLKIFKWQFGLYITLVLLILLSLIFFLVYCCCKMTCGERAFWPCFYLFVIFFLIFLGLFIAILVFIGISQYHTGPAYCAIHSLPATVLYGNPNATHNQEFIGFAPLANLVGNYTEEFKGLKDVTTNAATIVSADLKGMAVKATNQGVSFWTALRNKKTKGVSQLVVPDLAIRHETSGYLPVDYDFDRLTELARELDNTGSQVKFASNQNYVDTATVALKTFKDSMDQTVKQYDSTFNEFPRRAMKIQSYAIAGLWTFFGLGIAVIVLAIIAIIILASMKRGKCLGCFWFLKVLLIVLTIVVIIYGICVLILMAGVAGGSAFCDFAAELNQGGWTAMNTFERFFNDTNTSLNSTNSGQIVKSCFFKNSTGSVTSMLNATLYVGDYYDRLVSLVHGITVYNNYLKSYKLSPADFPGYDKLLNLTKSLSNGDLYDNIRIYDTNKKANSLVSCSGNQYALTSTACTNYLWNSCSAFPASFSGPACSSDAAAATSAYNSLSSYLSSESSYLSSFSVDSKAMSDAYLALKISINGQSGNVAAISEKIAKTVSITKPYNNNLKDITNCNNIQAEMIQFERYVCFPFVKQLYVLLVLATVSTFFLFVMLWALWAALAALRAEPVVVEKEVVVERRGQTMVAKDEFLAVSEQELVPKY